MGTSGAILMRQIAPKRRSVDRERIAHARLKPQACLNLVPSGPYPAGRRSAGRSIASEAFVGLAVLGKALLEHHDPMRQTFMRADEQCAGPKDDPGADARLGRLQYRLGIRIVRAGRPPPQRRVLSTT
jgi:hypothetical protein